MLYVALSCLQGRPMRAAFDELAPLAGAIQLTPGNIPGALDVRVPVRTHHGFAFDARKREVWSEDGACLVESDSVHPPKSGRAWDRSRLVEVMYPGYELGGGAAVEGAMRDGLRLAVDVSHVWIQLAHGVMTEATWRKLADYDRIEEVHVSANAGAHDTHQPITEATFGLAWVRERFRAGVPVVLESYMHVMPLDARKRQIELVREA